MRGDSIKRKHSLSHMYHCANKKKKQNPITRLCQGHSDNEKEPKGQGSMMESEVPCSL